MAKKFSELEKKMSPEQIKKSDELYRQMLAELDSQALEPDLMAWLKVQNSETKFYVNDLVRNVMNSQKQALQPQ